jgi:UDP-glucuronate 4-epimerase
MQKNVLVTGAAGFIGYHLTKALIDEGYKVTGIDNINNYYDPDLKNHRLQMIQKYIQSSEKVNSFNFFKVDISDDISLKNIFNANNFDIVVNLAAQAGVRYSLERPSAYVESNLVGFTNLLECCRHAQINHFIFASSSSVYGMNIKQPFSTSDNTDYPISLYAATKKSNELLAFSYSHLFDIPMTGLRFFTVYGPFGRPDMAYFKFTKAINNGDPIDLYNYGEMQRDFTYIDDIVDGLIRVIKKPKSSQDLKITDSNAKYSIYNIGNNKPITLNRFIEAIEDSLSKKAIKNLMPMQDGDVPLTYADIDSFVNDYGFKPKTSIEEGIDKFINWYLTYN